MATRKKKSGAKKSKGTRRHHRVGAMSMKLNAANPLVQLGSAAVGFLLGDTINAKIDTFTGTMDKKIVGGVEGGIGAALMFMKLGKKPKSLPEVVIGGVIGGAGVKRLLQAFGIINGIGGYQSLPVIARTGRNHLNGYNKVPAIGRGATGGYTTSRSAMNGTPGYATSRAPQTVSNQVMGSAGSGYNSGDNGSDYMG